MNEDIPTSGSGPRTGDLFAPRASAEGRAAQLAWIARTLGADHDATVKTTPSGLDVVVIAERAALTTNPFPARARARP